MKTQSTHQDRLCRELDSVHVGAAGCLSELDELPEQTARELLGVLVAWACQSQHVGSITAAREAVSQVPSQVVERLLPGAVERTLDLDDDWEYRRLLELLNGSAPSLLAGYVEQGLKSSDPEIREAALDFARS